MPFGPFYSVKKKPERGWLHTRCSLVSQWQIEITQGFSLQSVFHASIFRYNIWCGPLDGVVVFNSSFFVFSGFSRVAFAHFF